LGGIWLAQIISEMIKPYSTKDDGSFDLLSLILGICIVSGCILVVFIFFVFPGRIAKQERHDQNVMQEIAGEFEMQETNSNL
jgi:hypothetical protein